MENIFKMLSDFSRVRLINILANKRFCVTELSNILEISISAVSRHLAKLKLVGIIEDEQDAQWVYYKLNESFRLENKLLVNYIKHAATIDKTLIEDNKRVSRYTSSNLCCKDLNLYPEQSIKVLRGDENE